MMMIFVRFYEKKEIKARRISRGLLYLLRNNRIQWGEICYKIAFAFLIGSSNCNCYPNLSKTSKTVVLEKRLMALKKCTSFNATLRIYRLPLISKGLFS